MRWHNSAVLILAAIGAWWLSIQVAADEPKKKSAQPQCVVIPFDFESKFDDGAYGQTIGDMIWKKLERRGNFVIPESMLDVREWCQRNRFLPGADTPLDKLKTAVRQDQGGDIGIWGKVERARGSDTDVYDLSIFIVDFSVEPPKTVFQRKVRTQTASEIPHLHIKEALDALYGKSEEEDASVPDSAILKERWEKAPNLVEGDFEKGEKAPLGWDPLPKHVSWVTENAAKNRIIRFTIPPDVAETTGVLYYSAFFPIEEGAKYRFQCRWRTTGTAAKVFIKCYDNFQGSFRQNNEPYASTQRREVYRSQQNLSGPSNHWNTHTEDFTPKHTQFTPRWGRVMLYAYYPSGTVEWDDVIVKQIVSAPKKDGPKVGKLSLESKVRAKDTK